MTLKKMFEQQDKILDRMTTSTERELIKAYSQSLKKIRADIAEIYAKYGTDEGLTFATMQKFNRLSGLEKTVQKQLVELTGNNAKTLKSGLGNMYEEAYFRTAFIMETDIQAKLAYTKLNPKTITTSIQNPISGLTLNDTLSKNRQNVIISMRQQITQGLINGESFTKMSKRLKDTLEGDASKALRVARTEAHKVQQDGRLQSLKHAQEQGVVMKKQWQATLDGDTRDAHQNLDGVQIDLDEDFTSDDGGSGKMPGQLGNASDDINCRCTAISVIKGFEPTQRRARGEGVIPQTTYNEWKKERIGG